MKGDFLGFSFNTSGKHYTSEGLGIIRVSDGDRYKDSLVPEIEDKTVEIPGMDGVYFYGSNFKSRTFSLSIAFDRITEEQLRKIRQAFGYKHTGELIFDEAPYKKYMVKVASPPELDYVCFDERKMTLVDFNGIKGPTTINQKQEETERIYKGEGTLEFIAYYPFAKQVAKVRSAFEAQVEPGKFNNIDEWWNSSGLLTDEDYNTINEYSYVDGAGAIYVYNPGDIETGFRLEIPFKDDMIIPFTVEYGEGVTLHMDSIAKKGSDYGIQINTVNGLVEGLQWNSDNISDADRTLVTSGNIYNEFVTGEFFKIRPNDKGVINKQLITIESESNLDDTDTNNLVQIDYDYLYF